MNAAVFTLFSVRITWLHILYVLIGIFVILGFLGLILEKKPRIRLFRAFGHAFRVCFRHYGAAVKFLITELCLLLISISPLLFLADQKLWFLAFLAVPAWILVMLPSRVNAAAAMQEGLENGNVFNYRLADLSRYGKKLLCGLRRALFLLIWTLPLAAGLCYAYRLYVGTDDMDAFTLLQSIQQFGGGDVVTGVHYVLLITVVLILIVIVGIAFHSGARHAWALGSCRKINGHHGKMVVGWFWWSIITMLPFIAALIITVVRYLPVLGDPNGLLAGSVKLPRTRTTIIILGAGGLLTLPWIPLRSLIIAAMVHQLKDQDAAPDAETGEDPETGEESPAETGIATDADFDGSAGDRI